MEDSESDITFETNNAERLIYILRNAINISKYSHLKDKWSFRNKGERIICVYKAPLVKGLDLKLTLNENEVSDSYDQIGIVQYVISNKPEEVTFTDLSQLDQKAIEKLKKFALSFNYSIDVQEDKLTFTLNQT